MIATTITRRRIRISGTVQGVGFRPFIFRLASELGLCGWVNNSPAGVLIDVEAPDDVLEMFVARIESDRPPNATLESLTCELLEPVGYTAFEIRASETNGAKTALVLPDLATCPECQRELFDLTNRRYHYPFTNCTDCGPRFTIIEGLPYDRPTTTMKHFAMCPECRAEYDDPRDRRFHAQPNACPTCGPHLELWDADGRVLSTNHDALLAAANALRRGQVVAVKGLGGFHLMVDARNDAAVAALRDRKGRATKPLAIMVPSLDAARTLCDVSDEEAALLQSAAAPIVLLERRPSPRDLLSRSGERKSDGKRRRLRVIVGTARRAPTSPSHISPSLYKSSACTGKACLAPTARSHVAPSLHKSSTCRGTACRAPTTRSQVSLSLHKSSACTGTACRARTTRSHVAPLLRNSSMGRGTACRARTTRSHTSPSLHKPSSHSRAPFPRLGGRGVVRSVGVRGSALSPLVAPSNPMLGVMLPYTPLHHILMRELGFPVVATSGNRSGEPICTDEREALERLRGIADLFLVHNRPIARHADDSIARVVLGKTQILRRARGYAPLPVIIDADMPPTIAAGAHLKNAAAVAAGRRVFISQHIGDMDTPEAFDAYTRVIRDLSDLYNLTPERVVSDLHPDYRSTQWASARGLPTLGVQHHYAHVLSCMAEHGLTAPVLGVAWDGTGLGTDGTIWGGEFLLVDEHSFRRFAHLQTFRLPGGEQAIREPRRSALGLLHALYGDAAFDMTHLPPLQAFTRNELRVLRQALERGLNAPVTSSAGRLFDAVSSLVGLAQTSSYEGEAAMLLEFSAGERDADKCYPWCITSITGQGDASGRIIDLKPVTEAILMDLAGSTPASAVATRFHNTLVDMIVGVARAAAVEHVALSGGCFQNRRLLEGSVTALERAGFRPVWHQQVPSNDGGIALGQVAAALREPVSCV